MQQVLHLLQALAGWPRLLVAATPDLRPPEVQERLAVAQLGLLAEVLVQLAVVSAAVPWWMTTAIDMLRAGFAV